MSKQPAVAKRNELTVSELTKLVKSILEDTAGLTQVWVRGEASNVKLAGSGHLYFTLKDEGAQLRVAYFAFGQKRKPPTDGEALLVHGDVRVYEVRGEYQLVADDLIKAGVGDLAARFEALKQKLHAEGLFEAGRKVAKPLVPQRIAVVTSPTTAALRDVLNVLSRRAPYLEVVLFPSVVQGEGAPPELIAALQAADRAPGVELILLVRGGGSLEDLWCFNDEGLARALADIEHPVITGVGHEIDFTIVDFIADFRAPTPSAAAELCAPDIAELSAAVGDRTQRLGRGVAEAVARAAANLSRTFDHRLIRDVRGALEGRSQGVDGAAERLVARAVAGTYLDQEYGMAGYVERLARPLAHRLEDARHRLPRLGDDLLRVGRVGLAARQANVSAREQELNARDPRAPKKLGFALVWDADGNLVRDADAVPEGAHLRVEVQRGEMEVLRSD